MKQIAILVALIIFTSCASVESKRSVSASGDPSEIFFEKEIAPMDREAAGSNTGSTKPIRRSFEEELNVEKYAKAQPPEKTNNSSGDFDEIGMSSWYGAKFHGKPTASGEKFDKTKLTAAHPTLPLGSIIRVQNLENQKEVLVKINDRGPFVKDRIIDLSEKAAETLDFKDVGIAKVGIKVVKRGGAGSEESEDLENADDEETLLGDETGKPEKLHPQKSDYPNKPISGGKYAKGSPKGFTVQVGVFRDQNRAETYKSSLGQEYGEKTFLFTRDGFFVIQIGDFSGRNGAESLKSKLKNDGIDCFIPKK
ncbi:septal ring lytic transglycosylase RlpA family protein [Leptospira gomenensis]|uniref:Probable endolytic peptidoglycan transglycosylase RlpA n=1 Tax=Leptospira gomenensis TaxID=2484974 RepID=A0A5F1YQ09_9LEPT|nr:septal ring lytic transglycosylase RlpA family protein [Leptospira gomenensis]TGK28051.1 septal ring lytic transglycosylase RlpA family protein [Leptospira gomenensis]TGK37094.1 septal ring lytic transglycosylase RlpA family protein [Leptospira gomenensis]TGK45730.1 septal ring lytic transglycosylase RlpA family protein [Leptospira gomenensis]TGK59669.1 septal ring lytic transglycosylase RlpA family protein [Leptospira gomenensis]